MIHDYAVVGGGIIGVSVSMHLLAQNKGSSLVLLEKENALALHQTGRNSGVVHAGVYYQPGSLKASFCKEGAAATVRFCAENGLPFEQCGKLIVATDEPERMRLAALRTRCVENGIEAEDIDGAELARREPHIHGLAAVFIPSTGIVDYVQIVQTMAAKISAAGGQIVLNAQIVAMREEIDSVVLVTPDREVRARNVVVCAGVMADRLARMCGLAADFRIVPFRGEYYRLPEKLNGIVKHLIYPVPDPALPFLGVHLTRMIGGHVTVGPNAVLGFARENYRRGSFSLPDTKDMLLFPGFWSVIGKHLRSGAVEMRNSLFRSHYLELCRRYCPELTLEDLHPHPTGIRAQAVMDDGTLLHDFLIRQTARTVHVCNAPSPAATSAFPIGRYIVNKVLGRDESFGG